MSRHDGMEKGGLSTHVARVPRLSCDDARRYSLDRVTTTRLGRYLEKMFCKMFYESSTVALQLPCCPGKQWELAENCLQTSPLTVTLERVTTPLTLTLSWPQKESSYTKKCWIE